MSRDWLLYLDDLIDSAEKVQRFLKNRRFEEFASDEMLLDAAMWDNRCTGNTLEGRTA